MMEPWQTKHNDKIIKFIIGRRHIYKIRLDIIVSKMINKTIKISRTPHDLRKTTLQKNLTKHYFEVSRKDHRKFVYI